MNNQIPMPPDDGEDRPSIFVPATDAACAMPSRQYTKRNQRNQRKSRKAMSRSRKYRR